MYHSSLDMMQSSELHQSLHRPTDLVNDGFSHWKIHNIIRECKPRIPHTFDMEITHLIRPCQINVLAVRFLTPTVFSKNQNFSKQNISADQFQIFFMSDGFSWI